MYEVREHTRKIDGMEIPTFTREIISANVLSVEAGTNGFQGGDSGHSASPTVAARTFMSTPTAMTATRALRSFSAVTVSWKPSSAH